MIILIITYPLTTSQGDVASSYLQLTLFIVSYLCSPTSYLIIILIMYYILSMLLPLHTYKYRRDQMCLSLLSSIIESIEQRSQTIRITVELEGEGMDHKSVQSHRILISYVSYHVIYSYSLILFLYSDTLQVNMILYLCLFLIRFILTITCQSV